MADTKSKTTKKAGLFRRLRELATAQPYISFDRIKETAQSAKLIDSIPTLKDYLTEAVTKGILHDAGKGWYSRLSEPARLDWDDSNPLPRILAERFPLLPHFVWSSQQVNPWMHHLLGRFVNFIYVDADGAEDVCEFLEGHAWAVTLNPTKKTGQNFHARQKNAVVRGLRRAIDPENEPTPEGLLVDLYMENERLGLMDKAEYQEMALNLCSHCRIDMARLLHLLGDRKKSPEEVLGEKPTDYLGIS